MKMNQRTVSMGRILGGIGVGLVVVATLYYFVVFPPAAPAYPSVTDTPRTPPPRTEGCLGEAEASSYELIDNERAEDSGAILVKDTLTGREKRRFVIPLASATHYHPLELHPCGVYAVREFNYDYRIGKPLMSYKDELVKYDYQGRETVLMVLYDNLEKEKSGDLNYSDDFRIDPHERYLVLNRGYLGSPDFALIIKDLKTLGDVFVLPIAEVEKKNPDIVANLMFNDWTKDGRYFWANFFVGAPVLGYLRIDSATWTYEVFPAPEDVLGGDALNLERGYITVHPGNVWYGVTELEEAEKAQRQAQDIGTELYVYHLITGARHFVAKTDEPMWYFKPRWISEHELEYTMLSGEKKIYTLPG